MKHDIFLSSTSENNTKSFNKYCLFYMIIITIIIINIFSLEIGFELVDN